MGGAVCNRWVQATGQHPPPPPPPPPRPPPPPPSRTDEVEAEAVGTAADTVAGADAEAVILAGADAEAVILAGVAEVEPSAEETSSQKP